MPLSIGLKDQREIKSFIICVDSLENNMVSGRVNNSFFKQEQSFSDLGILTLKMDALMDGCNYPVQTNRTRSFFDKVPFRGRSLDMVKREMNYEKGKIGTIKVIVKNRHDSQWECTCISDKGEVIEADSIYDLFKSIRNFCGTQM